MNINPPRFEIICRTFHTRLADLNNSEFIFSTGCFYVILFFHEIRRYVGCFSLSDEIKHIHPSYLINDRVLIGNHDGFIRFVLVCC